MEILWYLRTYGGRTDEEMQKRIPMRENTQRPRRRELQLWGLVVDSGTTRATGSGRQAVVWTLAPAKTPTHRGCSDTKEGTK
jgi:hypothetical protein